MTAKKGSSVFSDIISARQQEPPTPAAPAIEQPAAATNKERTSKSKSKRDNPDYSPVTVYIPTTIYANAQLQMTLQGRKREMSELFTELLEEWLARQ